MNSPEDDHGTRVAQQAGSLARTVGAVLTHHARAEGRAPEDAAEVEAITDAMVRLLIGAPLRSDGKLTIKSLADEAGLRRNKLTHKHTGLKDLFYALVKTRDSRPQPPTDTVQAQKDQQQIQLARLRAERDDLQTLTRQLARIVHVLELENQQLRDANADLERELAAHARLAHLADRRAARQRASTSHPD